VDLSSFISSTASRPAAPPSGANANDPRRGEAAVGEEPAAVPSSDRSPPSAPPGFEPFAEETVVSGVVFWSSAGVVAAPAGLAAEATLPGDLECARRLTTRSRSLASPRRPLPDAAPGVVPPGLRASGALSSS
jgi:hypothetical protein